MKELREIYDWKRYGNRVNKMYLNDDATSFMNESRRSQSIKVDIGK